MDLENLRRQYASLTDEALLDIDPDELTEVAHQCLQNELERRDLRMVARDVSEVEFDLPEASLEKPDWLDEAFLVYAETIGRKDQPRAREALAVLVKAGIPCYSRVSQDTDGRIARSQCELLVPSAQQFQAMSLLDKEIFNVQLEADWRGHFGIMSDDELLTLDEDALAAGLRDRADRLIRAWEDELLKRGLAELETGSGD